MTLNNLKTKTYKLLILARIEKYNEIMYTSNVKHRNKKYRDNIQIPLKF